MVLLAFQEDATTHLRPSRTREVDKKASYSQTKRAAESTTVFSDPCFGDRKCHF